MGAFAAVWERTSQRYADIAGLEHGRFEVKGIAHDFGSVEAIDWNPRFTHRPDLLAWTYELAFFSFAPVLVQRDPGAGLSLLARLLTNMEHRHPLVAGGGKPHFVWDPMNVALRTLGLVTACRIGLDAGIEADCPALASVARHVAYCAAFLDRFAERYLSHNHPTFALVALTAAEIAVHGGERASQISEEAARSIIDQVLPDGLQGERTATYHIHVLILLQALIALDAVSPSTAGQLEDIERSMRDALDVLVHPDGEIALFNDSAIGDSVPPKSVGWVPRDDSNGRRLLLAEAGYAKLSSPATTVIFDAGELGPSDVIGHAHGDFLSCEISVRGTRLLTDPGVFSYTRGQLRDRTRSAASHNGPGYRGLEPAEFFGAWRVGRRGRAWMVPDARLPRIQPLEVAGICDGYDRFGGRVLRYVGMSAGGKSIMMFDLWRIAPGLAPTLNLLFPEDWTCEIESQSKARLEHPAAGTVLLNSTKFAMGVPHAAEWRPFGAMVPRSATAINLMLPEAREGFVVSNLLHFSLESISEDALASKAQQLAQHLEVLIDD